MEYSEKICKNAFFKDLSEDNIQTICKKLSIIKFKKDDYIIKENSHGNGLYLLIEGEIIIDKNLVSLFENDSINNEDNLLRKIKAKDNFYFGEMSLFNEEYKRNASIIATSDAVLAKLSKEDFDYFVEKSDFGKTLLKTVSYKLSVLLEKAFNENSKLIAAFVMALKH